MSVSEEVYYERFWLKSTVEVEFWTGVFVRAWLGGPVGGEAH